MQIVYGTDGNRKYLPLAAYLQPTNTSSSQGSIEQLEAEVDVLKKAFGELLALLVEQDKVSLEKAEKICGIHESYKAYRYPNRHLVGAFGL